MRFPTAKKELAPVVLMDVAERPFNEDLTEAGRIYAHGLGMRLD